MSAGDAEELVKEIRKCVGGRMLDGDDEYVSVNATAMLAWLRRVGDMAARADERRLTQFTDAEVQVLEACLVEIVDYTLGQDVRAHLMPLWAAFETERERRQLKSVDVHDGFGA